MTILTTSQDDFRSMIKRRRSVVPAYVQLAEQLKSRIKGGEFAPGALMPNEQELIKENKLSRITVRAALKVLEHDGWIIRKQGIGTFAGHPVEQELSSVRTIPEVLLTLGMMPDVKVLSFGSVIPPADVQRELKLQVGERVLLMKRIYRSGNTPIAFVHVYLPLAMMRHAEALRDEQAPSETTYTILERKLGLTIKEARHVIRARNAKAEEAKALRIKLGAPILVLERLTLGTDDQALEYDVCHYDPDRFAFSVTVPRQALTPR
jgi:GntR family transcriptional regulator